MTRVTADQSISLDGFTAGPDQSADEPLGVRGEELHTWMFEAEVDHAAEREAILEASAYVMGRNMFAGPGPGEWDPAWRGWWGEEPPYHGPVFVLTHQKRDDLPMEGGTTFHFVNGGIEEALDRAREAAGDGSVSIAGGAETLRQCLAAGLVDELRLHVSPIILGAGERLFDGLAGVTFEPIAVRHHALASHLTYRVGRAT
jgi:dihydrofolate reductase